MTFQFRARQTWTIAKIEMRRAFFSKRAFWVYLLAIFPAVIFFGHGLDVKLKRDRWSAQGLTPAALIDSVNRGATEDEVIKQLGKPVNEWNWQGRRRERHEEDNRRVITEQRTKQRMLMYFDGHRQARFNFTDGVLTSKNVQVFADFSEDRQVFAGIFQYFYLRLAIFFGCLGIFINLFRGEMLDKTLHYWFLAPARRDVLLAGKYVAGLVASTVIFTCGAMLCFAVMMWPHDPSEVQAFWQTSGPSHLLWYAAAAALGCMGYGSVFLAAGLLIRNPIVPAAILLTWESINPFLPSLLQKMSVLYYLQSMCPVPAPMDNSAPTFIRMLLSPADPASHAASVIGVIVVTGLVLWAASRAVRRIEVSYSTES